MANIQLSALASILNKFEQWGAFSDADRAALLNLPHTVRQFGPNQFILQQGDKANFAYALLSGFAIRHKVAHNGGRQILSLHMVDDLIELQHSLLKVADHHLQAIGLVEIACIPAGAISKLAADHPEVARAMWRETLVEASILREALLNTGRRSARVRVAHFVCEMSLRLQAAGLASEGQFTLPVSQEQIGDMLGLTSVHVNRTLQALGKDGVIERDQKSVIIRDWKRLTREGDFNAAYLHLEGTMPAENGLLANYVQ